MSKARGRGIGPPPPPHIRTTSVFATQNGASGELKVVRGKKGTKVRWPDRLGRLERGAPRKQAQSRQLNATSAYTPRERIFREEFGGLRGAIK